MAIIAYPPARYSIWERQEALLADKLLALTSALVSWARCPAAWIPLACEYLPHSPGRLL